MGDEKHVCRNRRSFCRRRRQEERISAPVAGGILDFFDAGRRLCFDARGLRRGLLARRRDERPNQRHEVVDRLSAGRPLLRRPLLPETPLDHPIRARALATARRRRDRVRRRLSALPRHPIAQPRDLLGREADGLLDPEHPRPDPDAPALGSVVRGRVARLLRVRAADDRVPDPPDRSFDALHLQPRLRVARRTDAAGIFHAPAELDGDGAGRCRRRRPRRGRRQPLRAARVARQSPRPRLELFLGDLPRHQRHHQ